MLKRGRKKELKQIQVQNGHTVVAEGTRKISVGFHNFFDLSFSLWCSLIAVLSRDLREDFLPFLGFFLGACLRLLDQGADREPDVLEQVSTSISYVFKHLVKYLAKDLTQALK
jgi:hypothetical protein